MSEVRRAGAQDIPGIMELLLQVNMVHHNARPDLFEGPATKYTRTELEALLDDPERPVYVCAEDGRVLGHAFCILQQYHNALMTPIKTLYIDDICVDEAARGKHVGKRLYEYVLDRAREMGCYNVTLNVWACNPGAQKFYERCGMVPQKLGMETIL